MAYGKVWGDKFVIHNLMSLNTFNSLLSFFISNIKDLYHDPFQPEIKLDFFDKYFLQFYQKNLALTLKRKILRELKNTMFSDIKLSDSIDEY